MDKSEKLIHSWLEFNMAIKENDYLEKLTFNEIVVCHYLKKSEEINENLTTTDLSMKMRLFKSQINLILNDMIDNGYIEKVRSNEDKRVYHIKLTDIGREIYNREHVNILNITNRVVDTIGEDDYNTIVKSFIAIAEEFRKIK